MDAMAAVDARLLARILPDALAATRRAYQSAGNLDGLDDAEEAAAAGIVAWLDAARDHPRAGISVEALLSLEPWTGGGRYEEGAGARAIARVLRAAAADAHVEGGAEFEGFAARGDSSRTPGDTSSPGHPPRDGRSASAADRDERDEASDEREDERDDEREDVELLGTVRGGVRGASPDDISALLDEICLAVSVCSAAGPEPGAVPPAGTTTGTGIDDEEHLVEFLSDCPDPNLAARVLSLAHRLVECPNVDRGFARASALIRAGAVDIVAGLLRAAATVAPAEKPDDPDGGYEPTGASSRGGCVPADAGAEAAARAAAVAVEAFVRLLGELANLGRRGAGPGRRRGRGWGGARGRGVVGDGGPGRHAHARDRRTRRATLSTPRAGRLLTEGTWDAAFRAALRVSGTARSRAYTSPIRVAPSGDLADDALRGRVWIEPTTSGFLGAALEALPARERPCAYARSDDLARLARTDPRADPSRDARPTRRGGDASGGRPEIALAALPEWPAALVPILARVRRSRTIHERRTVRSRGTNVGIARGEG